MMVFAKKTLQKPNSKLHMGTPMVSILAFLRKAVKHTLFFFDFLLHIILCDMLKKQNNIYRSEWLILKHGICGIYSKV